MIERATALRTRLAEELATICVLALKAAGFIASDRLVEKITDAIEQEIMR